ncbi:hypothetical protein cyc_08823 [Cyclospora cayetanensis]|uniref:Uncharacterized protein n=1 Tax=Cyclospora cayetanensis TaxID=88456 RepID=A0A1D3CTN8_9EIME|nr:hypothetical protein cyc_08823 [Cyclospora cayetanensis]
MLSGNANTVRLAALLLLESDSVCCCEDLENRLEQLLLYALWRSRVARLRPPANDAQVEELLAAPQLQNFSGWIDTETPVSVLIAREAATVSKPPRSRNRDLKCQAALQVEAAATAANEKQAAAGEGVLVGESNAFAVASSGVIAATHKSADRASLLPLCRLREAVPRPRAAEWQQLLLEAEDLPVDLSSVRQDIAQALQQQQEVEGQLAAALGNPDTAASLTQLRELQRKASSCSVYISCLGATEERLRQLQDLETASAQHLEAEDTPRAELQRFVEEQQQLLQLPIDTPDLPCYTHLKEACSAVAAWIAQTAQLHAVGGSLRQWQQHVERGLSLRIKPEGLEELQRQLRESADWCIVYQHLLELRVVVRCQNASAAAAVITEMLQESSMPLMILPRAAAASAASTFPQQQIPAVRAYVPLLDAERLTRKPFGLGQSLLPFAELQQHVRKAQRLRQRCARALQQSTDAQESEEIRLQRLKALQKEQEKRISALQLLSPDAANALLWKTTQRLRRLAAACAVGRIHIKERRLLKVEVLLRVYNHRMLSLLRCPRHSLAQAEQLLQQIETRRLHVRESGGNLKALSLPSDVPATEEAQEGAEGGVVTARDPFGWALGAEELSEDEEETLMLQELHPLDGSAGASFLLQQQKQHEAVASSGDEEKPFTGLSVLQLLSELQRSEGCNAAEPVVGLPVELVDGPTYLRLKSLVCSTQQWLQQYRAMRLPLTEELQRLLLYAVTKGLTVEALLCLSARLDVLLDVAAASERKRLEEEQQMQESRIHDDEQQMQEQQQTAPSTALEDEAQPTEGGGASTLRAGVSPANHADSSDRDFHRVWLEGEPPGYAFHLLTAYALHYKQLTGGKISWPVSDIRSLHPLLLRLIESKAKRRGDHASVQGLWIAKAVGPPCKARAASGRAKYAENSSELTPSELHPPQMQEEASMADCSVASFAREEGQQLAEMLRASGVPLPTLREGLLLLLRSSSSSFGSFLHGETVVLQALIVVELLISWWLRQQYPFLEREEELMRQQRKAAERDQAAAAAAAAAGDMEKQHQLLLHAQQQRVPSAYGSLALPLRRRMQICCSSKAPAYQNPYRCVPAIGLCSKEGVMKESHGDAASPSPSPLPGEEKEKQLELGSAVAEGFFDTESEVEEVLQGLFDPQRGRKLLIQKEVQQLQTGKRPNRSVELAGADTAIWQGVPWSVGLEDWEVPACAFGLSDQALQQQQQRGARVCKGESLVAVDGECVARRGVTAEEEEEVLRLLQGLQSMAAPVLRDDAAGSSMRCMQHISRHTVESTSSIGEGGGVSNVSAATVWLYRRSLLDFDFYENEDVMQLQQQEEEKEVLLPEALRRRLPPDRSALLEETLRTPLPQVSLLSLLRLLEALDGLPLQVPLKGRIAALLLHAVDWAVRAREAICFLPRDSYRRPWTRLNAAADPMVPVSRGLLRSHLLLTPDVSSPIQRAFVHLQEAALRLHAEPADVCLLCSKPLQQQDAPQHPCLVYRQHYNRRQQLRAALGLKPGEAALLQLSKTS